jgi:hypothetical protein
MHSQMTVMPLANCSTYFLAELRGCQFTAELGDLRYLLKAVEVVEITEGGEELFGTTHPTGKR